MAGKIAELYAEALFELCSEESTLEAAHSDINEYNTVFAQNGELIKLLSSPAVNTEEKLSILTAVFNESGMVFDFICLLAEKGRIAHIDEICESFNKKYNEFYKITEVTVTTSIPLTDELREKLTAKLHEKSGRNIRITQRVNPEILGGLIIEYDNVLIDNSVKGKLERISRELKA